MPHSTIVATEAKVGLFGTVPDKYQTLVMVWC